jgi:hypothetical protein
MLLVSYRSPWASDTFKKAFTLIVLVEYCRAPVLLYCTRSFVAHVRKFLDYYYK